MTSLNRSIIALIGGLVLTVGSLATAGDWPQWRGADRDGQATGFVAPADWPAAPTRGWEVRVGLGDSTPALVGDKLYVFARFGKEEVLLCLDAATGKELWRDSEEAPVIQGAARGHAGPRSSPTVSGGRVITLGVGGVLICRSAEDGKVLWRKDEFGGEVPTFFPSMSPIVVGGLCIAHLGKEGHGALMAFDVATGDLKWKWDRDGPSYASPVLMSVEGTEQIVAMTEKNVVGIGADSGELLWSVPFEVTGRGLNSATPVVDESTVIFAGQGRGTTAVRIEKTSDGFAATESWNNEDIGFGFCTPILRDGILYGRSDRGSFFSMDARTGETLWHETDRGERFGSVVDTGSAILALPSDGELVAFDPNRESYVELARYKVSDSATYAHPVVAGNRVFIKGQDTLTLWTIE